MGKFPGTVLNTPANILAADSLFLNRSWNLFFKESNIISICIIYLYLHPYYSHNCFSFTAIYSPTISVLLYFLIYVRENKRVGLGIVGRPYVLSMAHLLVPSAIGVTAIIGGNGCMVLSPVLSSSLLGLLLLSLLLLLLPKQKKTDCLLLL